MVPRSRSDEMVKVKVNITISGILSFIWILDIKQQSNMLLRFYSLKFKNILFSNKLFSCTILQGMVHIAQKVQIKYFAKN